MSIEFKTLLKKILFIDIAIGTLGYIILSILFSKSLALIMLIGLTTALINFFVSGILFEKGVNSNSKGVKIIFPIIYILKFALILIIAIPFINNFKNIMAFFVGFTMHFPILILSWFINQKGSG